MKNWLDLTDGFPMKFDVHRMLGDIKRLDEKNWLTHYDTGLATGWTAIPLISLDGMMGNSEAQRAGDISQYQPTPLYDELPYLKEIVEFFNCPKGRVRLMKLKAGGYVGAHRDVKLEVANLAFGQIRLHIPICTNEQVFFFIGREKIHMKEGRLYYANFSKVHSVINGGTTTRIHLMLDVVVNDWLAQFFPALTLTERIHCAVIRRSLPVFWALRDAQIQSTRAFWKAYNGSRIQKLKHRLRRRATVDA